jgi:hypothetical protein
MEAAVAVFVMLAAGSALCQKGNPSSRSAEVVLHIQVNIVPVVLAPRALEDRQDSVVSFYVPVSPAPLDVKENIRVLPASAAGVGTGGENIVLKTLTIVAK